MLKKRSRIYNQIPNLNGLSKKTAEGSILYVNVPQLASWENY